MFFPPQAVHAIYADGGKRFRYFCIKFNMNRIRLTGSYLPDLNLAFRRVGALPCPPILFTPKDLPGVDLGGFLRDRGEPDSGYPGLYRPPFTGEYQYRRIGSPLQHELFLFCQNVPEILWSELQAVYRVHPAEQGGKFPAFHRLRPELYRRRDWFRGLQPSDPDL